MISESANQSAVSRKLATLLAGALAVFVGGMVLVGWALDIAALKSILPGWVSMKPNAALAFILTGIVLWSAVFPFSAPNPDTSRVRPGPTQPNGRNP